MDFNSEYLVRQLHDACWYGRDSEVLSLLKRGIDPNSDYYSGETSLIVACWGNHSLTTQHLIKWGASLTMTGSHFIDGVRVRGWTALHCACYYNSMDCVKVLLDNHTPTEIKDSDAKTAEDRARQKGFNKMVEFISQFQPPPRSPLSSYPSVKQLSELQVDQWSKLGLHLGLTEDEVENINKYKNPTVAMFLAAKVKNTELKWKHIVGGLVEIGEIKLAASVCSEQGEIQAALSVSARHGSLDFFKYLVHNVGLKPSDLEENLDGGLFCLASTNGHFQFAKYLVTKKIYHISINCSLLHAAKCGHRSEAELLLTEYHADPNVTDDENMTPLALATDPEISILLLKHGAKADDVYRAHSKHIGKLSSERPPDNPLPVFITGDGGVGKSTFLKSMLSSKGFLAFLFKAEPVTGVDEKTVGIIPYEIETKEFGKLLIYDFAGQQVFYASHCAILENAVQTSAPVIVHLSDLKESKQKIEDSTVRWMTLVQNQCTNLRDKAHVIVVGSHADILRERNEDPRSKEVVFAPILKKFPKLEFRAFVPMDCRYPDTDEMKEAKKLIQSSSAVLRSPETISLNAHTLYIYLLDSFKDKLAVSLKNVQQQIHSDLNQVQSERKKDILSFIPSTLPRLVEICDQLSKKGLILYLHNEGNPDRSFIVCDCTTLLSNVTGTVFAPENFRQHCDIASSTGVVSLSKFSEEFEAYDIDMLIAFMSHLELCFEITDIVVLKELQQNPEPDGRYLFFPGLIKIETPEQVWDEDSTMSCHFGWIIECSQDIEFFDPRCLQVLILRLVFTFGLAPARKVQEHLPSLQRFCSVWKNGIFWCNDDGISSHLELSDNNKAFVFKTRSRVLQPEFQVNRSQIITKVLETVRDFSPNVKTVESVIKFQEVVQHPLKPSSSLTLCSVPDIAKAVSENKDNVKCEYVSVTQSQLLQFEPYTGLDKDTFQCIHSEKNTKKNEKISEGFMAHFAKQVSNIGMYTTILRSHHQDIQASQSPGSSKHELLVEALRTWREKTEGTYSCLRETLNKYSIFTGRNPLDLASVAHSEIDPSLIFPDPPIPDPPIPDPPIPVLELAKVKEATKEVRSDWYSLAIELEISYSSRKEIKRNHSSVKARFHEMLQQWVTRRTPPLASWSALIRALSSPVMGRGDIAEEIKRMTETTSESHSDDITPTGFDPQAPLHVDKHLKMVREQIWDMRAKWRDLGQELGITVGNLNAIQHDHHHIAGSCLTDVLECWLTHASPPPTWSELTKALVSPSIERKDIATDIEAVFKTPEEEQTKHSDS